MRIVKVMNSPQGRTGRVLAGVVLIAAGVLVGGTGGLVLAAVGLVPLAAGPAGVCLAAPLLRAPLRPLTWAGHDRSGPGHDMTARQGAPGVGVSRPGRLLPGCAKVLVVIAHPDDESVVLGSFRPGSGAS